MHYSVNETVYRLASGTGIIVNSSRLHFGYSVSGSDCVFIVLLLHLSLLGGNPYIQSKYVNPLLYDTACDAIVLSEDIDWNRQALLLIKTLFQLTQEQPDHYELQTHIQFASLWLLLYEKQTLHQTPFEYLLHYRIQKSLSLLKERVHR